MDIDSAYRRIHTNTRITIMYNLSLLCLSLPYVKTPALTEYITVS